MIQLTDTELDGFARDQYVIRDHFLPANWAHELRSTLLEHVSSQRLTAAKFGSPSQLVEQTKTRGDLTLWLSQSGDTPAEKKFLNALFEIREGLRQQMFLPLKWIEAHYAYYGVGQTYQKHWDNFQGGNARLITFVFYLNQSWEKNHGGELVLFDPQQEDLEIKKIEPLFNRLVLFKSDYFPHQVNLAHNERLSLTGWIRSDVEPTFT